jgi:multiple sugar transport system substrate-binding protein
MRAGVPWRIALPAGALAFAAACAPARHEVVFWQSWPEPVVRPIVDQFEREHPGVRVRVERIAGPGARERIAAAIDSGRVPDLCEMGSTWMPQMLATGRLADWSAGTADLRPRLRGWALCSVGDAVYGIPWMLGTRALFVNTGLLARAGVDTTHLPETWEELRAAAEAVQRRGAGAHGFGVQAGEREVLFKKFMPFAWGNGGRILSDDLTTAVFDSPENRAALTFYLGLREVGVIGTQVELDRRFADGQLAFVVSGAWLLNALSRDAPGMRFAVTLVPRPAVDRGTNASFAGGEVLVSFAGSHNKEQALELARFLARAENAEALAARVRSVQPAATSADTSAFYRARPFESVLVRQFEYAYFPPNHPHWREMEAAIEDAVDRALRDRRPAAEAAAAAISEAQQRLAELVGRS